jgi:hypothetical protein
LLSIASTISLTVVTSLRLPTNLVAKGQTAATDFHRDVDLLAVRTVIARIAALSLWVGCCHPFKVDAGYVIQQQIIVQAEKLPRRCFR